MSTEEFSLTHPTTIAGRSGGDDARVVPGWPGYLAGSDGHIYSTKVWRGSAFRRLAEGHNQDGYQTVQLSKGPGGGGRTQTTPVHKIIAAAFGLPRPSGSHDLRHLDGNKANNRPDNLAWGTQKQNAEDRSRHGRTARGERNAGAKLSEAQVREIKTRLARGERQAALRKAFGVPPATMSAIACGRIWGWLEVDCA